MEKHRGHHPPVLSLLDLCKTCRSRVEQPRTTPALQSEVGIGVDADTGGNQQQHDLASAAEPARRRPDPGVIRRPRLDPPECGYRLAVTGAIRDTAIDYQDVALFAAEFLRTRYPEAAAARFKLKALPEDRHAFLAAVGAKRGALQKGGVVDLHRASEVLLHELRQGMIGRLSLETPDDIPAGDDGE